MGIKLPSVLVVSLHVAAAYKQSFINYYSVVSGILAFSMETNQKFANFIMCHNYVQVSIPDTFGFEIVDTGV